MASRWKIPFSKPHFGGNESAYIQKVIEEGSLKGCGAYSEACEALLEEALGARKVLMTTSGTAALDLAALLLDLRPGDEVILPSFTFPSTANAIALRGATPIFADICADTLNLDVAHAARLITRRTRAVTVVHYGGVACDMARLVPLLESHGIALIEDNAHGPFCAYRGKSLGTFGSMAALSFHETKNFTAGEGGALLVNDPALIERALILRDKGTNRNQFLRGEVPFYHWVANGSNFAPPEIISAILLAQLERRAEIQARRKEIWAHYHTALCDWAQQNDVALPVVPQDCEQAYHVYYMLLPTHALRNAMITHLAERGIQATFHYSPLHLSPMGIQFGSGPGLLPVTESVDQRIVRLPFHNALSNDDLEEVAQAVKSFQFTLAFA